MPRPIAKTDCPSSSDSKDSKKKQKKRCQTKQTAYRDYIWKVLAVGLIPLLFLLFVVLTSNSNTSTGHSGSKTKGELTVKNAVVESTSIATPETGIHIESNSTTTAAAAAASPLSPSSPSSLRIQIASDLHIEFFDESDDLNFLIEPKAPILALLGDVGYACTEQLRRFLLAQSDRFEEVWFLAGNHEYYNHGGTRYSVTEQNAWLRQVAAERPNLKYLEQAAIPMLNGSVVVLATTLWSDIPDDYLEQAEHFLNDYRLSYNHAPSETTPRLLRANETREWYRDNLNWLESQLRTVYDQNKLQVQYQQQQQEEAKKEDPKNAQLAAIPQTKVVVLTHHTPLMSGTSAPQYEGKDSTHCFSSDLRSVLTFPHSPIDVWACGHTHHNFDLTLPQTSSSSSSDGDKNPGMVRVVSNQRGYQSRPKPEYQPDFVLEIHPSG
ncbi:MAG: hypothetical protein SGBAC_013392 [Bacillariaceae sp.]